MPKTLLLADDSVTIQKVVGLSFANEDVSLVTVDNGDDAITRARSLRPDVVLADVVMPGKNGYEVCEAIKADPALRHIPVLLLTGTFEAFDEERARRAGADGHITKPFEAQALVDTVNGLVARAAVAETPPTPAAGVAAEPSAAVEVSADDEAFDFFDDDVVADAEIAPDTEVDREPLGLGAAPPTVLAEADPFDLGEDESDVAFAEASVEAFEAPVAPAQREPEATVAMMFDAPTAPPDAPTAARLDEELTSIELREIAPEPASSVDDLFDRDGMFEPEMSPGSAASTGSDTLPPAAAFSTPSFEAPALSSPADEPFDLGLEDSFGGAGTTGRDPLAGLDPEELAGASVLDPAPARDYDVSWSDLGRPLGGADLAVRLEGDEAGAAFLDRTPTARSGVYPHFTPPEPASLPDAGFETTAPTARAASPIVAPDPGAQATPAAAAPVPESALAPTPAASPAASPAPAPEPAAAPATPSVPDLTPMLRERIHDMLEKVAWEAFSDLSDTIVRQALERVEAIAWEVIPQMAEALVREEIRRMKGEDEDA